ncbi:hypothetical protein ACTA71_011601 [Dictyostelium dimigraforme]
MSTTVEFKDVIEGMHKDLEGFFDKYDGDSNGKITYGEIVEALKKANKKNPEKIATFLFRNDTDKDGELSIDEVKARIVRMNQENIENVLNWEVEAFCKKYDLDGDKKITRKEVLERFTKLGALHPETITDSIFRQMDLNKDGEITVEEIREYTRKKKFGSFLTTAPKQ